MSVRLGFSCAVNVEPDIFIVDEALSVGDTYFQVKCMTKIKAMLDTGVTFIYVTHAADAVRSLCNKGLWLDHGRGRMLGSSAEVGAAYEAEMFSRIVRAGFEADTDEAEDADTATLDIDQPEPGEPPLDPARLFSFANRAAALRAGTGAAQIKDVVMLDEAGLETDRIPHGAPLRIRVYFQADNHVSGADIGLGILDSRGMELIHFSSSSKDCFVSEVSRGGIGVMEFRAPNILCAGEYGISTGIATLKPNPLRFGQKITDEILDYCPGCGRFAVLPPTVETKDNQWGQVHVEFDVSVSSLQTSEVA